MTLRERIADWISGGALTQARRTLSVSRDIAYDYAVSHGKLRCRLDHIASLETPKASHTVKRMARIARGEE